MISVQGKFYATDSGIKLKNNEMKVLLIFPNKYAQRYVSVGIAMISASLKKHGHEVKYFDTSRYTEREKNYSKQQTTKMEEILQFIPAILPSIKKNNQPVVEALFSEITSFNPGLIGFTSTSSEFTYLKSIVKKLKRHFNIPIIVGGPHATVAPLETLSVDGIDMVCVGEGELAIIELAESLGLRKNRTDIKNIYFKKNNQIIKNKIRSYENINILPYLDLDIFDKFHHIGAYQGKKVVYGRFETSRGCPFKCSYCINEKLHQIYNFEKSHMRFKSPERIIEELKWGMKKIKFDILRFVDETFTATPYDRLVEFVRLYRIEINKPMIIATRPERVNNKIMRVIRDANDNIQVTMGIESGSENIRKKICHRMMSNKTIIDAFHVCHDLDFRTASFNMIGLPDETREDFLKTIQVNREARVEQPMLSYFYPFPGTKLRDYCIKKGYIKNEFHEVDYAVSSVLNMPHFSQKEIDGLKRTFVLYVKMDSSCLSDIQKAEHDDTTFNKMVKMYNEQFFPKKAHKII